MSNEVTAVPDAERVLAVVREFVRETRPDHAAQVTLHSSFERDLALDSLARVELMLRAGKSFDVELPPRALSDADSAAQANPSRGLRRAESGGKRVTLFVQL